MTLTKQIAVSKLLIQEFKYRQLIKMTMTIFKHQDANLRVVVMELVLSLSQGRGTLNSVLVGCVNNSCGCNLQEGSTAAGFSSIKNKQMNYKDRYYKDKPTRIVFQFPL